MKHKAVFIASLVVLFLFAFHFALSTLLTVSLVEPLVTVVAGTVRFSTRTPYLYIRRCGVLAPQGIVTGVEVSVFNNNPRDLTVTVCALLYDGFGEVVGSGCAQVYVPRKTLRVTTIPIPQQPSVSSLQRVEVYES